MAVIGNMEVSKVRITSLFPSTGVYNRIDLYN